MPFPYQYQVFFSNCDIKNSSCLALDIEEILNQAKSSPGAETPSSVKSYFKDLVTSVYLHNSNEIGRWGLNIFNRWWRIKDIL